MFCGIKVSIKTFQILAEFKTTSQGFIFLLVI